MKTLSYLIRVQEHKDKINQVKAEIQTAKGFHKKDLIRYYNKLINEYRSAMMYLEREKL